MIDGGWLMINGFLFVVRFCDDLQNLLHVHKTATNCNPATLHICRKLYKISMSCIILYNYNFDIHRHMDIYRYVSNLSC